MNGSLTPPATFAVDDENGETRANMKERSPALWIGTAVAGTGFGYALGTFGPLIAQAFGITSEGISAIAAVAVAGFTWALVRANAASARHAQDTLAHLQRVSRQELRAYVMLDNIQTIEGTPLSELAAYQIVVTNSGKTPAYRVVIQSEVHIGPARLVEPIPVRAPDPDASCNPLAPGASVYHTTSSSKWTQDQERELANGNVVYLNGIVRYEDAFGASQWTRFCLSRAAGSHQLVACEQGNDAKRIAY